MRTRIKYDPKNAATRIVRSSGGGTARQCNLSGVDHVTKQARKTKKGAAEWLEKDDEMIERTGKGMFNPQQRESMLQRAGAAYKGADAKASKKSKSGSRKPKNDPSAFNRGKDESLEDYIKRIQAMTS